VDALADIGWSDLCRVPAVLARTHRAWACVQYQGEGEYPRDNGALGTHPKPIYVFGGLMSVGIFIFVHRPWWLLIGVPLIPLQVFRVRKEGQVLEAKFGDAYRDFKRRTWF
jgi:hypothetical protein